MSWYTPRHKRDPYTQRSSWNSRSLCYFIKETEPNTASKKPPSQCETAKKPIKKSTTVKRKCPPKPTPEKPRKTPKKPVSNPTQETKAASTSITPMTTTTTTTDIVTIDNFI